MDKSEPIKIKNIYRNPIGTFRPLLQSNQNRGEQETELHDGCQLGVAWRGFCEIPSSWRFIARLSSTTYHSFQSVYQVGRTKGFESFFRVLGGWIRREITPNHIARRTQEHMQINIEPCLGIQKPVKETMSLFGG